MQDYILFTSFHDFGEEVFGELSYRGLDRGFILIAECLDEGKDQRASVLAQGEDPPGIDALTTIGYDAVEVDDTYFAQTFTAWATAVGGVEGEVVWCRFVVG